MADLFKDRIAIASACTTGYSRDGGEVSIALLQVDACLAAIADAGVSREDIDGVVGPEPWNIQAALGIPELRYWDGNASAVGALASAAYAVAAGACNVALVYHANYRNPSTSRTAANDPFRRLALTPTTKMGGGDDGMLPDSLEGAAAYAAWAGRYLHTFKQTREVFGYIAINDRSNAALNPAAAAQEPITMDDYFASRMIRFPLSVLDMDLPVDGGDAFIVTTRERAKDMQHTPILIHAHTCGMVAQNEEDQSPSLDEHGQRVVIDALRSKSDPWIDDFDLVFLYDGFSFLAVSWLESIGYCRRGEARAFIEDNWDQAQRRILIAGRVPVNTHGGALSEGGNQAAGHVREAVRQLQGRAGQRQAVGARSALITAYGLFWNAQGLVLRVE